MGVCRDDFRGWCARDEERGWDGERKNRDKQFRFRFRMKVYERIECEYGTTKPYGNSCFKLKIRRQRGAAL